ncbi:MAG: hypothetical protein WBW33_17420 [Bryobacteraceae bacterium]
MEKAMTTCDQCGAGKIDVDHWFNVTTDFEAVQLVLEAEGSANTGKPVRHVCGRECLMKEVAEWAARMTAPMPGQCVATEQTPWPFTLANIALS